jgi:quercetin dioxygenase-like cupin family protein
MALVRNVRRDGKPFSMGNTHSTVVISPETGARHVTFNHIRYEPGAEFPQHRHEQSEDVFFVLEGSGWLRLGDERTPIGPGDVVWVPAGEVHGTVAGPQGMVVVSCQGPPDPKLYSGERDSSRGRG